MANGNDDELWRRVNNLSTQIQVIDERLRTRFDGVANREWVREVITPTQGAVVDLKNTISLLASEMKGISQQVAAVFAAHNEFLEEKRQHEKRLAREQTPVGLIKKYAPIAGLLTFLIALFRVLGTLSETWISHVVTK